MISHVVNLFNSLFVSCLQFTDIILFLSAVGLMSVIVTVVTFLLKGKY